MEYFLQQLINGLTLGAIYGLIAIGYTMVYGIIGMINFAHGEIYMIGAFIALIAFVIIGPTGGWVAISLVVVLLISMLLTAVYGWTLERIAYRPLRGSPRLAALISAVVALARPQWDPRPYDIERRGRDLVFALDVSRSMLAADVFPNRLELARIAIPSSRIFAPSFTS